MSYQAKKEEISLGKRSLFSLFAGLIAGFVASLIAVLSMGSLRFFVGIPTPVELFGDFLLKQIRVDVFVKLLGDFAPNSKAGPLWDALLAMIAIGTLLGILYAFLVRLELPLLNRRPGKSEWLVIAILVFVLTLAGIILFWEESRQNTFGLTVFWSRLLSGLGLLLDFCFYGITLCYVYRQCLPQLSSVGVDSQRSGRRHLLISGGIVAASLLTMGGIWSLIQGYLKHYTVYDGMTTNAEMGITPDITSNETHYVVTKNVVDPRPEIALWRFDVGGLFNRSGTYTYDEIKSFSATSRPITLECIANDVGRGLISTAVWHGFSLQTLLDLHGGARPEANHIVFFSVDGYNISLPLKDVLEADALFAWEMNGEILPVRHGYPLRVIIPGHYGEESPKWLTRVELTDHFVNGLYSSQGWYNGPVRTMSRIDRPVGTVATGKEVEVGGIAYAGTRGIAQVEVSVDGGTSWQTAVLGKKLSRDSWVQWHWNWTPTVKGNTILICRATDGLGQVQTSKVEGTVPGGATGYHQVLIVIA